MRWLWTALITPFKQWNGVDNEVDYEVLEKILDMQIEWWVDGVLLLWTTAESSNISIEEWKKIVTLAIKKLLWKTKIMVNVGTYSTKASIDNIARYDNIDWIDAYLVVNPYYSKPTQTGLFQHFTTIAQSTSRNIFLYNIACRTNVNLETSTLLKIVSKCDNIVWVKEASGNIEQVKEVIAQTPDDFIVLSWEESLTYDLIKSWWDWVVSVASNCVPAIMKNFVDECLAHSEKAGELQDKYLEFFNALFIQTNPLPAKTYLASKGIIKEEFRLPLCRMDETERTQFLKIVEKYGL